MWIEPGSSVSLRSRRRAVSVPTNDYVRTSDVGSHLGSNKARTIASHAHEDTNAIAAASKRHDRDFMNEVSAKMANLAVNANLPPVVRHTSSSRDSSANARRRSPSVQPTAGIGHCLRRVAGLTPDDSSDIAAYLNRLPVSLTAGRAYSQPPPVYGHQASVPRWYPLSTAHLGGTAGRSVSAGPIAAGTGSRASSFPVGLPPRAPGVDRMNAITDSVIGVARTSQYGDIVIGIPYKKHYMYDIQHEIDDFDTIPKCTVTTRSPRGPYFAASTRLGSSSVPELSRPYSRASYAGPGSGGIGYGYRPGAGVVHQRHLPTYSSSTEMDDSISAKNYPATFANNRATYRRPSTFNRVEEVENDVDGYDFDESGAISKLSSLRKQAKSVLDRYSLPPRSASAGSAVPRQLTNTELDHKYGQILSSMQAKNNAPPPMAKTNPGPTLPPYPAPRRKYEMSDTRRAIRELLCRTRDDPHYFDS